MTVIAFDSVTGRIATIDGGTEPPPVIWTSHPYPIEVIENMNVGGSLSAGRLFPQPILPIDMAATLLSGDLTVVIAFETYTAPPELLDMAATLLSGDLTVVIAFETYTAPPELLDMGATLLSGYLDITVNHDALPENLDMGATLIGGTLT